MKMPKAWIEAGTKGKAVATSKAVTAKSKTIDMSAEVYGAGLCPSCHQKMSGPVFCGGRPMQVCWDDRVALPYLDEEHKQHMASYKPFEQEEPNYFGH